MGAGTPVAQLAVLTMLSACRLALVGVCVPFAWLEESVTTALKALPTAPNVAPRDQLTALSADHRESITSARRVIHRFPSGSSRKEHRARRDHPALHRSPPNALIQPRSSSSSARSSNRLYVDQCMPLGFSGSSVPSSLPSFRRIRWARSIGLSERLRRRL